MIYEKISIFLLGAITSVLLVIIGALSDPDYVSDVEGFSAQRQSLANLNTRLWADISEQCMRAPIEKGKFELCERLCQYTANPDRCVRLTLYYTREGAQ